MNTKKLFALICGMVFSTIASANVIYTWHTVSTSPSISSAFGEIEITDAAWRDGSGSYSCIADRYHLPSAAYSNCLVGNSLSPIVSFKFGTNSAVNGMSVNLHEGTGWLFDTGFLDASFGISGAFLSLDLSANTGESDIALVGDTITSFNSDNYATGCGVTGYCTGASGFWKLKPAAIPEPGPLSLLGIGLLALSSRRMKS